MPQSRGIATQKPLERDRPEDAPIGPPREAFLGLERGLQPVRPVAIGDHTARELVDNRDAAIADDVVDVAAQERPGVQRAVQLGEDREVLGAVQAAAAEGLLDLLDTRFGQLDVAAVLVGIEVDPW